MTKRGIIMDQNQQHDSTRQPPRHAAKKRLTKKQWQRRRRLRLVRNWAVFLSACGAIMFMMTSGILWLLPKAHALVAGPKAFAPAVYEGENYAVDLKDKRLVLVNANLPLEAEPSPELAAADDATGQQLEAEAAEAYRQMAEAAKTDGVTLTLVTGWQDEAAREAAFDAAKQAFVEQGCDETEAEARAATVQPRANANEAATGYAAEILSVENGKTAARDAAFAKTRAYEWLSAYAAEYGFILRWPEDRQAATGMIYEPWHWRYVGTENALAIRDSGLSLEEFLASARLS